ncbi:hypothetical protein ABXT72_04760 [Candidatus Pelagibacter sp. Uisw_094]|uniref:hypothetical protein n=1 Tax=Candidatus Pelagibacter sp. Uisw_094 TaxID=3230980 RepID=UPI0039EA5A9A
MSKPINLLKLSWIIFSVVSVGFLISFGVTSYESRVVDEPNWMLCEADKGLKKPQYIKFHNTKKVIYNIYQQRWVEDITSINVIKSRAEEARPTIEIHEDKTRFTKTIYKKKQFLIYVSDKYYVFYKKIDDNFFWSSEISKATAQHIIIKRDDLTMLDYKNEWVKALRRNKKYTDGVIDKLFKEADGYSKSYEDILFSNGKTVKTQRLLDVFQCKETAAVKAKI